MQSTIRNAQAGLSVDQRVMAFPHPPPSICKAFVCFVSEKLLYQVEIVQN